MPITKVWRMIPQVNMRPRATAGTRHSGENDWKAANR